MIKRKSLIPPQISLILLPLGYIVVLLAITIYLGNLGLGKIRGQKKEIESTQKTINTLNEKLDVLNSMELTIQNQLKDVSYALPISNPALTVLYQIKSISSREGVSLQDLSIGVQGLNTGLSTVSYSYTVSMRPEDFSRYIGIIKNISPVTSFVSYNLAGTSSDIYNVEIKANSYWSIPPEKIPAVTEAIKKLSNEDLGVLESMAKLEKPTIGEILPSGPYTRPNPFEI